MQPTSQSVAIVPRLLKEVSVAVATDESGSEVIDANYLRAAMITRASGSSLNSVTVYAGPSKSGPFLPLKNPDGDTLVVAVTNTEWIVLPQWIFPAPVLKLVGNAAGTIQVAGKG